MRTYHVLTTKILFLFFMVCAPLLQAEERLLFPVDSETVIEISLYPANGDTLFLWLYSEAGPQQIEHKIASQLADNSIEVWRMDLFAAYFLPVASSSMDKLPAADVTNLIEYAHSKTGKKIILVTTGRGSLPILKGANLWQNKYSKSRALRGVILLSPKFYIETPDPGEEGELLDIVKQTNLALFIIQPKKSPWYWKLDKTIPALEKNGSDVFLQILKNVRDRYYFRADADEYENKIAAQLPTTLNRAATYLNKLPDKKRKTILIKEDKINLRPGKKDRRLSLYKGSPIPEELILNDLHNTPVDLKTFKGNVVLVNFWASWCPPCVHEMPSMQRLQDRFLSKGFTILGVNMGEDRKTVLKFLSTKVDVNFPILFDSDGSALKRWHVFAFPTSYVIDKKGEIRYAIFGGVDWEKESIVKKIADLLNE